MPGDVPVEIVRSAIGLKFEITFNGDQENRQGKVAPNLIEDQ